MKQIIFCAQILNLKKYIEYATWRDFLVTMAILSIQILT